MIGTIFLLTNNKINELIIKNSISDDYNVICTKKGNLMMDLYKINPEMLIVDIDSYGEQIIDMIQTILSIDYIPIIYTYSELEKYSDVLKDEIIIPLEKINESIVPIIKQASIFKNKYDSVKESYNAIDLLNGSVKALLTKYVGMRNNNDKIIIEELINLIYGQNIFLTNKPEFLWIFSLKGELYNARSFQLDSNKYKEEICLDFNKSDSFKFDIYASNGFSKNFNLNEISDIGFGEKLFPKAIKKYTIEISNFAGFAIENFLFIGMNYQNNVTSYDIDIIKALTINFDLIHTIQHQVNELEVAFEYTTDALARAAETNDDTTGHHIKRVNSFAKRLAEEINMSEEFIKKINHAAQMHDVGKIYIDKNILTKPGKLTEEEFECIKKHTIYGEKIIGNSEYLKMSAEVARSHHEKYDGTGYPDGKKGDEIAISARIVFLADIYDALRSERPYKLAFSHQKAYEIITKGDGRVNPEHFDPVLLTAFKKIHLDFDKIYEELKD